MTSGQSIQLDELMQRGTIQLTPLSPTFGVQIVGLDVSSELSGLEQQALRQALYKHQLLLFRRQALDEAQQIRVAQVFGACRPMWQPDHYRSNNRLVHYLSNVDKEGNPVGHHPDPDSTVWHSDGSWSQQPARATVLNAVRIPQGCGDTSFANMYRVYEDLDQATRKRFSKLKAEHHYELARASRYHRWPWQWWHDGPNRCSVTEQLRWWKSVLEGRWLDGKVIHPLIRLHPQTNRPALFIGDHGWRIAAKLWPLGIRQMSKINRLPIDSSFVYRHQWQQHDLLIWDNASLLHKVEEYEIETHVRIMRRCVVMSPGSIG